jgi:hypothetical protein
LSYSTGRSVIIAVIAMIADDGVIVSAVIAHLDIAMTAMIAHIHLVAAGIGAAALPMSGDPLSALGMSGHPFESGPAVIAAAAMASVIVMTAVMSFADLLLQILSGMGDLAFEAVQVAGKLPEFAAIEMAFIDVVPQTVGLVFKLADLGLELASLIGGKIALVAIEAILHAVDLALQTIEFLVEDRLSEVVGAIMPLVTVAARGMPARSIDVAHLKYS